MDLPHNSGRFPVYLCQMTIICRLAVPDLSDFRNFFGKEMENAGNIRNRISATALRYAFDEFEIDPVNRILLRGGRPIPLTAKVFDILMVLVENSDRLLE